MNRDPDEAEVEEEEGVDPLLHSQHQEKIDLSQLLINSLNGDGRGTIKIAGFASAKFISNSENKQSTDGVVNTECKIDERDGVQNQNMCTKEDVKQPGAPDKEFVSYADVVKQSVVAQSSSRNTSSTRSRSPSSVVRHKRSCSPLSPTPRVSRRQSSRLSSPNHSRGSSRRSISPGDGSQRSSRPEKNRNSGCEDRQSNSRKHTRKRSSSRELQPRSYKRLRRRSRSRSREVRHSSTTNRSHRYRSPNHRRSISPYSRRSRTPNRRSLSPYRHRTRLSNGGRLRTPCEYRRVSPYGRKSRTSSQRRSRTPSQRRSITPRHRRSRTPSHRRSRTPRKHRSRTPRQRRSRTPRRRRSRTPSQRRSRTPSQRRSRTPRRRRSRSSSKQKSRTPSEGRSRTPSQSGSRASSRPRSPDSNRPVIQFNKDGVRNFATTKFSEEKNLSDGSVGQGSIREISRSSSSAPVSSREVTPTRDEPSQKEVKSSGPEATTSRKISIDEQDELTENSKYPRRFVRLNFANSLSRDLISNAVKNISENTNPTRVIDNSKFVTVEYNHEWSAKNATSRIQEYGINCQNMSRKDDRAFILETAERYCLADSRLKKSYMLVTASLQLLCEGSQTHGYCTVPLKIDMFTWNRRIQSFMQPYFYMQNKKKRAILPLLGYDMDESALEYKKGDTSVLLNRATFEKFARKFKLMMKENLRKYSKENIFDDCILAVNTWREASALFTWIQFSPNPSLFSDIQRICIVSDQVGSGDLLDVVQLHSQVDSQIRNFSFQILYQSAHLLKPSKEKPTAPLSLELCYSAHNICLLSIKYCLHDGKTIILEADCLVSCNGGSEKYFSKTFADKDEKMLLENLFTFCGKSSKSMATILVVFTVTNTLTVLLSSLWRHNLYTKFASLFSSFTDLYTVLLSSRPSYDVTWKDPDFGKICKFLNITPVGNSLSEVNRALFDCLESLLSSKIHKEIRKHGSNISTMHFSSMLYNYVKVEDDTLNLEGGETVTCKLSFNAHVLNNGDLRASSSLQSKIKIKIVKATKNMIEIELTNESDKSVVLRKGEKLIRMFNYPKELVIPGRLISSSLDKTEMSSITSLDCFGVKIDEEEEVKKDETVDSTSKKQSVAVRQVSVDDAEINTSKMPLIAESDIDLFPKQSERIEVELSLLKTVPKTTVTVKKEKSKNQFTCKLKKTADVQFGKLSFLVVSLSKSKITIPKGHCFGYANVDPSILDVQSIKISFPADSSTQLFNEEEQEVIDVTDDEVDSPECVERTVILQEPVEITKRVGGHHANDESGSRLVDNQQGKDSSKNITYSLSSGHADNTETFQREAHVSKEKAKNTQDLMIDQLITEIAEKIEDHHANDGSKKKMVENQQRKESSGHDDNIESSVRDANVSNDTENDTHDLMIDQLITESNSQKDSIDAQKCSHVNDNNSEKSCNANIAKDKDDAIDRFKFCFLEHSPQYKGLISAAQMYSKHSSHLVSDETIDMYVFCCESFVAISQDFVSFESIVDSVKELGETDIQNIQNYLDSKSMDLFSKIVPKVDQDVFIKIILNHISLSKDTIYESEGLNNVSAKERDIVQGQQPLDEVQELPTGEIFAEKVQNSSISFVEGQAIIESDNSAKRAKESAISPPSNGDKDLNKEKENVIVSQPVTNRYEKSNRATLMDISCYQTQSSLKPNPAVQTKTVTQSRNKKVEAEATEKKDESDANRKSVEEDTVKSNSSNTKLAEKVDSNKRNLRERKNDKPKCSKVATESDSVGAKPEKVIGKQSEDNQQKFALEIPNTRRHFVNLHLAVVKEKSPEVIVLKTAKKCFNLHKPFPANVEIDDIYLIHVNTKDDSILWLTNVVDWTGLNHCFVGKVVSVDTKIKCAEVEYEDNNVKKKAKLNQMRVKSLGEKKVEFKAGSEVKIHVFPDLDKIVSLAFGISNEAHVKENVADENCATSSTSSATSKVSQTSTVLSSVTNDSTSKVSPQVPDKPHKPLVPEGPQEPHRILAETTVPKGPQTRAKSKDDFSSIKSLKFTSGQGKITHILSDEIGVIQLSNGVLAAFHRDSLKSQYTFSDLISTFTQGKVLQLKYSAFPLKTPYSLFVSNCFKAQKLLISEVAFDVHKHEKHNQNLTEKQKKLAENRVMQHLTDVATKLMPDRSGVNAATAFSEVGDVRAFECGKGKLVKVGDVCILRNAAGEHLAFHKSVATQHLRALDKLVKDGTPLQYKAFKIQEDIHLGLKENEKGFTVSKLVFAVNRNKFTHFEHLPNAQANATKVLIRTSAEKYRESLKAEKNEEKTKKSDQDSASLTHEKGGGDTKKQENGETACSHILKKEDLCKDFITKTCDKIEHLSVHCLTDDLDINLQLFCKKAFTGSCTNPRCTIPTHKTYGEFVELISKKLAEKKEQCPQCSKNSQVPCKLSYEGVKRPCFAHFKKGMTCKRTDCPNSHSLPGHMKYGATLFKTSSISEFFACYNKMLDQIKKHCLTCAKNNSSDDGSNSKQSSSSVTNSAKRKASEDIKKQPLKKAKVEKSKPVKSKTSSDDAKREVETKKKISNELKGSTQNSKRVVPMCRYFQSLSGCNNGYRCKFVHDLRSRTSKETASDESECKSEELNMESTAKSQPDQRNKILCRYFMYGSCKNKQCKYLHDLRGNLAQ